MENLNFAILSISSKKGGLTVNLKEKVSQQCLMKGTHVHLLDASITEMVSYLGYDFIWLDMEHTQVSCENAYHHILAAHLGGTPIIVRVPVDDLTVTKRILEIGVDGIVFPMVKSYEHAKELISWTLYPPFGQRGCGPKRAVRYGLDSEQQFYEKGHLKMCRFIQIEQKSAALQADQIAQIPYLDGCILGMHDLSGSIHQLGNIFCKENMSLARATVSRFKKYKKSVGVSTCAIDEKTLLLYHEMGINMIATGADYSYILEGAKNTLKTITKVQST